MGLLSAPTGRRWRPAFPDSSQGPHSSSVSLCGLVISLQRLLNGATGTPMTSTTCRLTSPTSSAKPPGSSSSAAPASSGKAPPSAGVRREYSGTAGRTEIPQRGYPQSARRLRRLRHHPRTHLVDRELYLPSPGRTTVIAVAPPPDTGRHRRRLRARRPEVSAGAAGSASNAEACPPPCPNL
jgi:hypothetical protein